VITLENEHMWLVFKGDGGGWLMGGNGGDVSHAYDTSFEGGGGKVG